VVEKVTDKDGKFTVSGVFNPFVSKPNVTVYKKGFVAWSSRIIFPDYHNREDFELKRNFVFKLKVFKPEYSHNDHISFIRSAILSGLGEKPLIKNAYEAEALEALEERKKTWQ
jgi:hypothetical protein